MMILAVYLLCGFSLALITSKLSQPLTGKDKILWDRHPRRFLFDYIIFVTFLWLPWVFIASWIDIIKFFKKGF